MKRILDAFVKTFKNMDGMSLAFIYIGLELTVGLLAVSLVITLLEGHFGDYVSMIATARGARDAALSSGALSLVAAFLCDLAIKERQKQM